ncbi:4Fe-4S dicluster domain-containing protein [candidate division KSB1 bacterium]|nr:4Fe-4S dicluster domain-containing protein [candidate division KSB1 bacterium]NIR72200.1 4Fe-4S dicluster domain-containing protein [candidate division KSB1 bacterium]NIS26665.1 4Fe-4S dicluster domain-containing protein [candidate division KSB1 bacterium]NIT73433.1 4Fe-4S dicluster domain-containing protein [candidate division KSB1 bacterium]NIU27281.1 4Fe-4S dicluster domain-containing protein [candidate division KSB1 bacterium]
MDIEHVLENGNCHQCGVCVGVCPVDAITIEQDVKKGMYPIFHRNLCTDCDLCHIACPGEEFDWNQLQEDTFGEVPTDMELGYYREILSGYTNWDKIRQKGASGGIVSAILIALLEKGEIDGAVVTKMDEEYPLQPKVYIARTAEEILEAQQSKYLPVPVGVILQEIMRTDGRFAVVALPCHIHGIRLAQQKMPRVRKRIALQIGLICGFHPSFTNTTFLTRRAGVKNLDDVAEIRYRDDTWPGGFNVIKKDGSNNMIHPVQEFFWSHALFERERCATCTDAMSEFGDIVCGDEWRDDGVVRDDFKEGWSYIITRTDKGSEIVDRLVSDGVLYVEPTHAGVVKSGMMPTVNLKKKLAFAAIRIRKWLGLAVPNYHNLDPAEKLTLKHYVGAAVILAVPAFFEIRSVQRIFVNFPTKFFRKYMRLLYKCLVDFTRSDELKREAKANRVSHDPEVGIIRDNRKIITEASTS